MNIFIIGFMGSGKTHWGRIWAAKEKMSFFDLDSEVEHAFKMSVSAIFEEKGEEKFRELERYHLRKFVSKKNFILATGGGTPCFDENLEWMKLHGKVFYLKAEPELILEKVLNELEKRPLLKDVNPSELLFFIQKKLAEREPIYSQATVILEASQLNENSLAPYINEREEIS
ncbi:MAG: shikimate kinase [Ginsengibacter sp.]